MDKIKAVFENAQSDKMQLVSYKHLKEKYRESWEATYKVNGQRFPFSLTMGDTFKGDDIFLYYKGEDLSKDKENRIIVSEIVEKIIESFKTSSSFKLKMLLKELNVKFRREKYLILDTENFKKRKSQNFIEENKEKIKEKIEKSIKLAKNAFLNDNAFLVIKEMDEIPLSIFLQEEGYMEKIVSFSGEIYLKLMEKNKVNHLHFYKYFKEEMKDFGYNLYSASYIEDRSDKTLDESAYYEFFQKEDEYEEYYKK